VTDRAPQVFLARRIYRERDLFAVYSRLGSPEFDPRTDIAVMRPGSAKQVTIGGTARLLRDGPESFEVETDAGPGGAALVVQRTNLLFEAALDGRPAEVYTANGYRTAVDVPQGRHQVRFRIDRRPLHRALAGALAGLLMLPGLALGSRRMMPKESVPR